MSASFSPCLAFALLAAFNVVSPSLAYRPSSRPSRPSPTTSPSPTSSLSATSAPASRPASVVPAASAPASRPTSSLSAASAPASRPAVWKTGWFSFALPRGYEVKIDGYALGPLPVAYLRLEGGRHPVILKNPKGQTSQFALPVRAGEHWSLAVRWGKVGLRKIRGETSDITIRWYRPGQKPLEEKQPPGRFCRGLQTCVEVAAGETLEIRSPSDIAILPSKAAEKASKLWKREGRADEGQATLSASPQGAFWIDGRFYGMTPIADLWLPAGRRKLRVVNGYLGLSWEGEIEIQRGRKSRFLVALEPKVGSLLFLRSAKPRQVFIDQAYRGWTPLHPIPLSEGRHRIEVLHEDGTSWQTTVTTEGRRRIEIDLP